MVIDLRTLVEEMRAFRSTAAGRNTDLVVAAAPT